MGITSFYFLCFFGVILILYYSIPRKLQWGLLLLCSVAYYLLSGNGKTTKRKRGLRKGAYADKTNVAAIKKLIPYK